MSSSDFERRKALAIAAIRETFGTEAGEDNINLFIDHHLQELPAEYWTQHLGSDKPNSSDVLNALQFRSSWGENDLEYFDFTLPDDATNYVVSVHFDSSGSVESISMES